MLWNLLAIAACVYTGRCLFFLLFQRSFISMPTAVAHASRNTK
jgi:hypothetical protein